MFLVDPNKKLVTSQITIIDQDQNRSYTRLSHIETVVEYLAQVFSLPGELSKFSLYSLWEVSKNTQH